MKDKQFEQAYKSAGAWFVALYMEVVLLHINELNDDLDFKRQFIASIYNNGAGPDKDLGEQILE